MVTFFTDVDREAAGVTFEPGVTLAVAYDLGPGTISRFRVAWPPAPDPAPVVRCWVDDVDVLDGSLAFDTSVNDAWNWATPPAPIVLTEPAIVLASVDTRQYNAIAAFFAGGPVTRNGITALSGVFGPAGVKPTTMWPSAYLCDIEYTPADTGASGTADIELDLALAGDGRKTARGTASQGLALALAATGRGARMGSAAAGLVLTLAGTGRKLARGTAALDLALELAGSGHGPRRIVERPDTGMVLRPNSGTVFRP